MTRSKIRKRVKGTVKVVAFGAVCCTVIYASLLMITAKSFLKVQSNPVDL